MKKAVPAVLGILVLLLASACGSGTPKLSASEKSIAKDVAKALTAPTDALLTKKQATCVADRFVGDVGAKKLKSAKAVGADDVYAANGANATGATSAAYASALLGCIDEDKVLTAYQATVTKAFTASSSGVLQADDVSCFSKKFVKETGVKTLLRTKVITDAGEFNASGASLDKPTATNYADAFLGCVDYQKVQAEQVAKSDKTIDAVKLEACLKAAMPESDIRDLIVSNQTRAADATTLSNAAGKKAETCAKASKK